ncbi:hypothetical protein RFI_20239, partial [Reticulomyxa filosa]
KKKKKRYNAQNNGPTEILELMEELGRQHLEREKQLRQIQKGYEDDSDDINFSALFGTTPGLPEMSSTVSTMTRQEREAQITRNVRHGGALTLTPVHSEQLPSNLSGSDEDEDEEQRQRRKQKQKQKQEQSQRTDADVDIDVNVADDGNDGDADDDDNDNDDDSDDELYIGAETQSEVDILKKVATQSEVDMLKKAETIDFTTSDNDDKRDFIHIHQPSFVKKTSSPTITHHASSLVKVSVPQLPSQIDLTDDLYALNDPAAEPDLDFCEMLPDVPIERVSARGLKIKNK